MPAEISPIIALIIFVFVLYIGWRILRGLLKVAFFALLLLLVVGFAIHAQDGPVSTNRITSIASQWAASGLQVAQNTVKSLTHKGG
ncbi:hypothetical protein B1757_13505 [Acidithiobacillus marinus]|uniref:Uncharacterized protein n=1 Tax=Acidithiobacillus marinus TaxID=187490 RepID=A0A2I1DIP1_9PROT|nr:hypothetical protein [Acidithiobacillus marinus]PKY09739.1 hypothetical protein B1757_13505 [Acidithiobacillus marinus]